MNWKPQHPAFQLLLAAFQQQSIPVYVVGGVVRDHLLGHKDKVTDLDLVVEHSAIPLARQVADRLGWAFYPLDELRDVARLVFTARVDLYSDRRQRESRWCCPAIPIPTPMASADQPATELALRPTLATGC